MKKVGLILFILADLAIMSAAASFLYVHLNRPKSSSIESAAAPAGRPTQPPAAAPTGSPVSATTTGPATLAGGGSLRKILFKYPNSKARNVSIRADFTGWKAEPMVRDEKGIWTYQANLEPGEYGYAYSFVDETGTSRTVRDM